MAAKWFNSLDTNSRRKLWIITVKKGRQKPHAEKYWKNTQEKIMQNTAFQKNFIPLILDKNDDSDQFK